MTAQQRRSHWHFSETDGEADLVFDNSGRGLLQVPGFTHAVPIERRPHERFSHGFNDWAQNRLTAREVAMLRLMNDITDKPQWSVDILDDATIAEWTALAMKCPLISPSAWTWCLSEIQDKAKILQSTDFTAVYDSASRICKSDSAVSTSLLQQLASGVERLARELDHSLTQRQNQVLHLVDPDLFPLAYGRTPVISSGGKVGIHTAIEAVGQGSVAPKHHWEPYTPQRRRATWEQFQREWEHPWEHRAERFSPDFQWLPCEVDFLRDEEAGMNSGARVKISSYINNLHPTSHQDLYETIEQLISLSIEPWNEILVWRERGRVPERIRTYGVLWDPPYPEWAADLDSIQKDGNIDAYEAACEKVSSYLHQPDNPRVPTDKQRALQISPDWEYELGLSRTVFLKYQRIKQWLHPEPGVSFTYDQWKKGKNNCAIVPGRAPGRKPLPPKEDHEFYTVSLQNLFRKQGLQIVVEIGTIILTPEQPTCPATDWTLSGLLNDHIVATSIIYFSSTNVTPSSGSLSFRVEADIDPSAHIFGTDTGPRAYHAYDPLADIYGVSPASDLGDNGEGGGGGMALQELGNVLAPDGRLVAFPNVMQHRTEACALLDPTLAGGGRRRFIKLHLVDPHYRICSTRNTPPQRHDWWVGAGAGAIDWAGRGVPQEVVDRIAEGIGEWPMGLAEAERLKERFADERRRAMGEVLNGVERNSFGTWAAEGVLWA